MAFLAKSGKDSIEIAGHKVPIALIGGVAAVAGVLLVIRARKNGTNVASVGTPSANTGVNPVVDTFSTSPDISAQLSNITQELTNLQQSGINSSTSNNPPGSNSFQSPANAPAVNYGKVTGDTGGGFIHSAPNPASAVLGFFTQSNPLNISGPPVTGISYTSSGPRGVASDQWIPVSYAGGTGFIWAPETMVTG